MNLESPGPPAAVGFPGWRELRSFVRCPPAPEEGEGEAPPPPPPPPPGMSERAELQMKVDFFRKLGYSSEEVLPVLRKHGVRADTNTILGELVKHGGAAAAAAPTGEKEKEPAEAPREPAEAPLLPCAGAAGKRAPPGGEQDAKNLRPIVIDGSNVAMSHGDKDVFSCRGILLAVNWFLNRGHSDIMVFVPLWRKEQPRPDMPITDQHILRDLERKKILVFTPSRRVGGKRVVCYDDRFIVKLAFESDGIIVSNDVYRDLQAERPEWKKFIEERLLMYSFVNDKFMPPDDPLGRHGPSLDNFLRKKPLTPEHRKQLCPYGKKCTYGVKCKFYHPERLNQLQRSVADELRANARLSPTRSPPATKDERAMSRRPLKAEPLDPSVSESEVIPLLKAAAEKKSIACKAKPGEKPSHLHGGSRPSEWYQPQVSPLSPHMDSLPYVSQDHLDSGIGSLEGQFCEMWSSSSSSLSKLPPEPQAMSSCRAQKPPSQRPPAPESESYSQFQPQSYPKPVSTSHFLPPSRVAHHSMPGYSLAGNSRNLTGSSQKYWSEPYLLTAPRDVPRVHQLPYDPPGKWAAPDHLAEERANVRVRLCGIFHPHLVDAVMSRFPQLLDPQQLAAEILTYKSQNPGV